MEDNNNWRGGRSAASNGYVLLRVGTAHHLADVRGYAYEHRVVAEAKFGRRLQGGEQVHHKDGNKQNNDPDNIEILTIAEHRFEHRKYDNGKKKPHEDNLIVACECGCGEGFQKYDSSNRPRRFIPGHNPKPPHPTTDAIIKCLASGPVSRQEIIARTGIAENILGSALTRLKGEGAVRQVRYGVWCLAKVATSVSQVRDAATEALLRDRLAALSGAIGDDPGTLWNVTVTNGKIAHVETSDVAWTAMAGLSDDVRLHFDTGAYKFASGPTPMDAAMELLAKFSDGLLAMAVERERAATAALMDVRTLRAGVAALFEATTDNEVGEE